MTIRFYMDENVPRQITTGLRLRGVDTLTVQDDGLTGSADPTVFARATALQRVIFTRDDDFLAIAHQQQQDGIFFYGVIYSHPQTYGCAIHLDIIDGQVWIQHNSTEIAIDQELRQQFSV